jgi:hypothetical protein
MDSSLLLRSWRCLDDGAIIETEEDYRIHAALHPDHQIVAERSSQPTIKIEVNERFP